MLLCSGGIKQPSCSRASWHESASSCFIFLNERRCFSETVHNYSISGPHDLNDTEKVTGSKVKVSQQ